MENTNRKTIHVVAAIIQSNHKIFATQRGYGEFKDGWEFPGGKIEQSETPEQALAREIREELDTEIEVGELFDIVELIILSSIFPCNVSFARLKPAIWCLKSMRQQDGCPERNLIQ